MTKVYLTEQYAGWPKGAAGRIEEYVDEDTAKVTFEKRPGLRAASAEVPMRLLWPRPIEGTPGQEVVVACPARVEQIGRGDNVIKLREGTILRILRGRDERGCVIATDGLGNEYRIAASLLGPIRLEGKL